MEIKEEIEKYQEDYKNVLEKLDQKYNRLEYYVSVKTLKLNEGIIGFFYQTIDNEFVSEEACLRLYGFLQALFVSIDAIYTLSVALTNSKNFVRINDNPTLRELKYIRNDVVGHPTNRIVKRNVVYCTLNPLDIEKYSFKYQIHMEEEKERERSVYFLQVLKDYYLESTRLLDNLYNYQEVHTTTILSDDVYYMINAFLSGSSVNNELKELRVNLDKIYPNKDLRVKKKIDLLFKINKLPHTPLNNYTYAIHLQKLYRDIASLEKVDINNVKITNIPLEIKGLRKLFKNGKYYDLLEILKNHNNPSFNQALNKIITIAKKENNTNARFFFEEIRKRMSKNMYDEAYALEALLKDIR